MFQSLKSISVLQFQLAKRKRTRSMRMSRKTQSTRSRPLAKTWTSPQQKMPRQISSVWHLRFRTRDNLCTLKLCRSRHLLRSNSNCLKWLSIQKTSPAVLLALKIQVKGSSAMREFQALQTLLQLSMALPEWTKLLSRQSKSNSNRSQAWKRL